MLTTAKITGLAMMFATLTHPALAQERVTFPSADGKTTLTSYVFMPGKRATQMPAVVLMHGRGGVYSKAAKGRYNASTISKRHRMWGELWAANGYVAVLVDSFGPRGYPAGFPRFSYDTRPEAVNEVTVRPLDAYGALTWLRSRKDVAADRIGLLGWSNGGSAALATMAAGEGASPATPLKGFNAALVFYPACRLRGRFDDGYRP
jgi:dienelactone hydrolase